MEDSDKVLNEDKLVDAGRGVPQDQTIENTQLSENCVNDGESSKPLDERLRKAGT